MKEEGRLPRIPEIRLEQYLLGELSPREMAATKLILDGDADSRARLAALEQSSREILARYPADLMSRRIQSRLDLMPRETPRFFFGPWQSAAIAGAAAVLLLLLVILPGGHTNRGIREDASTVRIKGDGPDIKIYRKTADGSESLEDGTRAYPGDLIRIGYQAAGRPYGVIVSIDGWGKTTLHLPHQGTRAVRLNNDGRVLLDFALELDDAPRWERFYFVTSDAPFDVTPVLEAARQVDVKRPVDRPEELKLPEALDQFVFSLEKGTHR